ncbi:MAG TPA: HAMP domain-containing sensor histidine kinase [Blastocatellia bacterium]|nr:HAMP domain-containing sensor histidine kinase [Blastocatellia bacterium]
MSSRLFPRRLPDGWLQYGVAVIISAVALGLTRLIDDPTTEPNTLLLFTLGVMFSSWYGGTGPGLVTLLLSALAGAHFIFQPSVSLAVGNGSGALRMIEFLAVSAIIIWLNGVRRSAQARAETAQAEAEKANRAKDEFLAMVSHELRAPLNSILGWAQVLRNRKPDSATMNHGLEVIERSTRMQAALIEDLLDVARIVRGELRLNVRPVMLAPVIRAALEAIRPTAEARRIQLRLQTDKAACEVSGDADRLQQIVWNLLSNAVKFTPSGGQIEISLEQTADEACIRVSDTGCGIAPDFLPRVFERFTQAERSASTARSGLGLGLAIVRHLVELHGGTIRAESKGEGLGAVFTVRLPLLNQPLPQHSRAEKTLLAKGTQP